MADTKISGLTALTGSNVDTAADILPIVDTSAGSTKKITVDELGLALQPFSDGEALVRGSSDATKLLRFEVDGFTTGTTRVLTAPNFDGTISTLAGTETLTNKSLTSPAVTGTPTAAGSTWTSLGTVTTIDINGGTIDGTAIGGSTPAAGAFTTLSATGEIVSTDLGQWLSNGAATTGNKYMNVQNTGGSYFLGIESSAGGTLLVGSSAYATVFTTSGATNLQLGVNTNKIVDISSTGLAVTGTISATGFSAGSGGVSSLGGISSGNGSATVQISVNGIGSGVAGGSSINALVAGTTSAAIGNYSNIVGGAYDATPTIYGNGSLRVYAGGVVGLFSSTGLAVTGEITTTGAIKNGTLTIVDNRIEDYTTNGFANVTVNYNGYLGGTTQFRNFLIYDGKQNQIASFSSTGLSVTGNLSASGNTTTIGNGGVATSYAGYSVLNASAVNGAAIVLSNTAGTANAEIAITPTEAYFKTVSAQDISFLINNSEKARLSSTGLAVTGALSTTGAFTLLGTPFTAGAGVRYISGGGTAGSFFTNVPTGSNHQWAVNDVAVAGINSTGLFVTGALSCSTNLTVTGGTVTTGSTTALDLGTSGGKSLRLNNTASAVNYFEIIPTASAGALAVLRASGSDTNVSMYLDAQAAGGFVFRTATGVSTQVHITHTASANRYITLTGSNGGNPTISVSGGELAVGTNAWTFGIANSVSPTSPNRTLTVTIGGTTYYIAAKTTND